MIFYFSSTGNSLYAAQKLAEAEQTECISITDVMNTETGLEWYTFSVKEGEIVGFVLPTYFCGLPTIVTEFLSKLHIDGIQEHYIFLVATYGAMSGNVVAMFQKKLAGQGLSLSAAYSICTIDSYLPMFSIPPKSEMENIQAKADLQLEQICAAIQKREINKQHFSQRLGTALSTAIMYPFYQKARKTSKFILSSACTGCGLCEKVCPCGAIRLENGKPVWVNSTCVLCLGCLHRCSTDAIDYGKKTKGKERYMNSHVTVPDKFL